MARDLHEDTSPQYQDKAPVKDSERPLCVTKDSDSLPAIKSRDSKSVTSLTSKQRQNQYIRRSQQPKDIQATVPRQSLIENFVAQSNAMRPAFASMANSRSSQNVKQDQKAARSLRNDMMKDYMTAKAQLDKI